MTSRDIVHHWVDGSKFFVTAGESGLTQNIYTGLQDFEDMGFLLHFLRKDDLFVDVGANAGAYSILACAARGDRGYAFEPVPATYERLVRNMRLNQVEDQVQSLNIGIGSERGSLQFTSGLGPMNHALPPGSTAENAIRVNILPLDEALAGDSPALMKIDVEGLETRVVQGARETLKNPSLQAVIMELNGSGSRYGWDDAQIVESMCNCGLNPYAYDPAERRLRRMQGRNTASGNTLFLRDEAYVLARVHSGQKFTVLGRQF